MSGRLASILGHTDDRARVGPSALEPAERLTKSVWLPLANS